MSCRRGWRNGGNRNEPPPPRSSKARPPPSPSAGDAAGPSAASLQPLQELDLPGMIEIVRGDAPDVLGIRPGRAPSLCVESRGREANDCRTEQTVLVLEERHVTPPGRRVVPIRQAGPVGAGARE